MNQQIHAGQIYWIELPKIEGAQHVQYGKRPAIIISDNKKCLQNSPTVQVVLCTSQSKNPLPVHMTLTKFSFGLRQKTTVLAESITTISKDFIKQQIGTLDEITLGKVKNLVKLQLGL